MNFAFDIDGTITAAPEVVGSMMRALKAAGHGVCVLTGTADSRVTREHWWRRRDQLVELGIGEQDYDSLIVFAPHRDGWDCKARWCVEHEVAFLLEDSMEYVTPALDAGVFCALVL